MANSIILGKVKGDTGATGPQGPKGEDGANGITPDIRNGTWWLGSIDTGVTAKGNEWFTGTSNPTTQGINGDLYLNTDTADVFKKENNKWELVINIKGQRGEQGIQGEKGESALTFEIGEVRTIEPNEQARVTNVGSNGNVKLNFDIPQGKQGEAGKGAGTKVFVGGFEQDTLNFETDPQEQINELKKNAGTGGGGTEYTAGNGIDIIDDVISIKNAVLDNIDSKITEAKATEIVEQKISEADFKIVNGGAEIQKVTFQTYSALMSYLNNQINNYDYKILGVTKDPSICVFFIDEINTSKNGIRVRNNNGITVDMDSYDVTDDTGPDYPSSSNFIYSGITETYYTKCFNFSSTSGTSAITSSDKGYITLVMELRDNVASFTQYAFAYGNDEKSYYSIGNYGEIGDLDLLARSLTFYVLKTAEYVTETYELNTWIDLQDASPFKRYAIITAEHTIVDDTEVSLVNDNPVLFAKYGFVIGKVEGQNVTIYALDTPDTNVNLSIEFRG